MQESETAEPGECVDASVDAFRRGATVRSAEQCGHEMAGVRGGYGLGAHRIPCRSQQDADGPLSRAVAVQVHAGFVQVEVDVAALLAHDPTKQFVSVGWPATAASREYPTWVVHSLMTPNVMCTARNRGVSAENAIHARGLAVTRARRLRMLAMRAGPNGSS